MSAAMEPGTHQAATLRRLYRQMLTIRRFETRVMDLYREGLVRGSTHTSIGMEAVPVGVCAALNPDDYITSTHRGHGHCIAKGGKLHLMMAELLGRATGYCHGKGGSMHVADFDVGILGANGIVGGSIGIATGAALAARLRGSRQVCVCFFGDGAFNQGLLYECANMASLWRLPVVYLCENNQYAMSTGVGRATSVADLSSRAAPFGIAGASVDGMDVLAVREAAAAAVERARAGAGPSLLVVTTYRFFGHNVGDSEVYRSTDEVAAWRERDPIPRFRSLLIDEGHLTSAAADQLEAEVAQAVEEAIAFARQSPEPAIDSLLEGIYA